MISVTLNPIMADMWSQLPNNALLVWSACLGIFLLIANQAVTLVKHFTGGNWATKGELDRVERDLNAQIKDMRAYVHEEVHKLRGDLHTMRLEADNAREGIHERLNALVIVVYEMRGALNELRETRR